MKFSNTIQTITAVISLIAVGISVYSIVHSNAKSSGALEQRILNLDTQNKKFDSSLQENKKEDQILFKKNIALEQRILNLEKNKEGLGRETKVAVGQINENTQNLKKLTKHINDLDKKVKSISYTTPIKKSKSSKLKDSGFKINIDKYNFGDKPTEYGTDLVVGRDPYGRKCIISSGEGIINISEFQFKKNFKIAYNVDFNGGLQVISLETKDGPKIIIEHNETIKDKKGTISLRALKSGRKDIFKRLFSKDWDTTGWAGAKSQNTCTLSITNDVLATFYVNGKKLKTFRVDPDNVYNRVTMSGIGTDDFVYGFQGYSLSKEAN